MTVEAAAEQLAAALHDAARWLRPGGLRSRLCGLAEHLAEPMPLIGVAGRLNAGKSTFSNAVTGGAAPTSPTECTRTPGRYRSEARPFRCTTVDTPGSDSEAERENAALAGLVFTDVVAYLTVSPVQPDRAFLDSLYRTRLFSPNNVIMVISRVDERVRAGEDPWPSATKAIDSRRRAPELRPLTILPVVALLAETSARGSLSDSDLTDLRDGHRTERIDKLLGPYGRHMLTADTPPDLRSANARLDTLSNISEVLSALTDRSRERPALRLINTVRQAEQLIQSTNARSHAEGDTLQTLDTHLTRFRRTSPVLLTHDARHALAALDAAPPGSAAARCRDAYREARERLSSGGSPRQITHTTDLLRAAARSDDRTIETPCTTLRHHLHLLASEVTTS